MKTYFLIIAAILLLTDEVYSQDEKKLEPQKDLLVKSDKEQIAEIDKITKEIKANLNSYKKVEKFKDSTDYRYIYKKDNQLQIVSIKGQYKDVSFVKEYYFHNGRLVFGEVTSRERKQNRIVDNEKMYLENDYMFAWIIPGGKVDPNSDKFKKAAKEARDLANDLRMENMK